jgi:hypothetical protein
MSWYTSIHFVDSLEHLHSQSRRGRAVELGNLVQDLDGFGLSASAQQELGRLVESEDEVAEAEDNQSHEPQDDDVVPPAHVTRDGAAGFAASDSFAGRQFDVATIFRGSAVGNARSRYNANGLPHREKRN